MLSFQNCRSNNSDEPRSTITVLTSGQHARISQTTDRTVRNRHFRGTEQKDKEKKKTTNVEAIWSGFDSFQPLSPFRAENNRRLMLCPAWLLKRITAFNNPASAKISQRFRITFASGQPACSVSLFCRPFVSAWCNVRENGSSLLRLSPLFPRKEAQKSDGEGKRTVRTDQTLLRFEFFLSSPPSTALRGNLIGHLSPATFRRVSWAVHY